MRLHKYYIWEFGHTMEIMRFDFSKLQGPLHMYCIFKYIIHVHCVHVQ